MKKVILGFAVFALAIASAAANSYRVNFYQPAVVNGTTFKPGEIKVEVKDNVVTLKQGKTTAEVKARVEQDAQKFSTNSVGVDGETKALQEIRLGGTNTKLIFGEKTGSASGN